ncbi:MAG: choice-of-anchor tandem repeat GloVer-containing protein [Bryobacteraceae bacterium]
MHRRRTLWTLLIFLTGQARAQTPVTTIHTFGGPPDGANPSAGVVAGRDGVLYGTTANGGLKPSSDPYATNGCGIVFSLTPTATPGGTWTELILHSFTGGSDGCGPTSGVVIGRNGVLFGTTSNGLQGGTAFSLTPPEVAGGAWTETVIHTFIGGYTDGAAALFGVVIGRGGVLYGSSFYGGSYCQGTGAAGCGTVYGLTPPAPPGGPWTETLLYSIGALDDGPAAGLAIDRTGVLYGTTRYGGGPYGGPGTVFSLTPPASADGSWMQAVLSNFTTSGGTDNGSTPVTPVSIGPDGTLYGTTSSGGSGGGGEVYSLTPPASPGGAWTYTVLWNFSSNKGDPLGGSPEQLTLTRSGAIFTASAGGGSLRAGTILALTPPAAAGGAWTASLVHTVEGADGIAPNGGLLAAPGGVLYGTTYGRQPMEAGGGPRYGTVYMLRLQSQ